MPTVKDYIFIAPTAFSDGEGAPEKFLLLRFGKTEYTKGQADGSFPFDDADADSIIADYRRRAKELVIDYDHATVNGGKAPAAGWITALEKTQEGLLATVDWTAAGKAHLDGREYRYHSPVIFFDPKTGHPRSLHSVALTNHPAFHGYAPLVADDTQHTEETSNMNEHLKRILEALGLAVAFSDEATAKAAADQAVAAIGELKTAKADADKFLASRNAKTFNDVEGQIAGMVPAAEKAELASKLAEIEAEKAVGKAFDDGKLVEAQRAWALAYAKENPTAFADFVKSAPKAVPGPAADVNAGKPPKTDDSKPVAFSDADLAILNKLGVTADDINKKTKED